MSARSVPQWVGDKADTAIPDRVRVRTFDRCEGRCHACTRKIMAGESWTLEHRIALINWLRTDDAPHGNRETNMCLTCCNCLPDKNAADVAEKAEVYQKRAKHILPREKSQSRFKRKMDGTVVPR